MVLFDVSLPRRKQDDAAAESTAIAAIGKALSALPDPEARLRVLRCAIERFSVPAAIAAQAPAVAAAVVAADPMLSIDGLHAFFEPAPSPQETSVTPHHAAYEEIGDLFDEPVLRVRTEMRVVARKEETHAPTASDDLRDLYEETVAQHHAELEAAVGDVYEQPAEYDALLDEPIGDLYDEPVMEYPAAIDDPLAILYEEQIGGVCEEPIAVGCAEATEEPLPDAQAAACADQSLDALVADFASALQSLTLQLQDVSA